MKKKKSIHSISTEGKTQVMRKEEVIDHIFLKSGIQKKEIRTVIEYFMSVIEEAVTSKKNVSLKGFMTFQVKKQASRRARNIVKDESIFIPARYKAVGKFSKNILKKLNQTID